MTREILSGVCNQRRFANFSYHYASGCGCRSEVMRRKDKIDHSNTCLPTRRLDSSCWVRRRVCDEDEVTLPLWPRKNWWIMLYGKWPAGSSFETFVFQDHMKSTYLPHASRCLWYHLRISKCSPTSFIVSMLFIGRRTLRFIFNSFRFFMATAVNLLLLITSIEPSCRCIVTVYLSESTSSWGLATDEFLASSWLGIVGTVLTKSPT